MSAENPSYLVLHGNSVVAEDLRELLLDLGAKSVAVSRTLNGETLQAPDIALLDVDQVSHTDGMAALKSIAATCRLVVLLTDGTMPDVPAGPVFVQVAQPFRSEDIITVLQDHGALPPKP